MMKVATEKYGNTDFDYPEYEFREEVIPSYYENETPEDMERNVPYTYGNENQQAEAEKRKIELPQIIKAPIIERNTRRDDTDSFKTIPVKIPFDVKNLRKEKAGNTENKGVVPLPEYQ